MTPHEIGRAAAALLRAGYAVEIDYRYPRSPVTEAGSGPAWHTRELRATLGYHAATALLQSEIPRERIFTDDEAPTPCCPRRVTTWRGRLPETIGA